LSFSRAHHFPDRAASPLPPGSERAAEKWKHSFNGRAFGEIRFVRAIRQTLRGFAKQAGGAAVLIFQDFAARRVGRGARNMCGFHSLGVDENGVAAGMRQQHRIGDRANREVLNIYESVFREYPDKTNLRWRIEHAQQEANPWCCWPTSSYMAETRLDPFPTALYACIFLLVTIAFMLLQLAIAKQVGTNTQLRATDRVATKRNWIALASYFAATPAAYLHPAASLVIIGGIAILYSIPDALRRS
jgi:hypothetical protein